MGRNRKNLIAERIGNRADNEMIAKLYIGFYQKIVLPKDFNNLSQAEKSKIINEYTNQIDRVKPGGWEINNIHIRTNDGKVERLI